MNINEFYKTYEEPEFIDEQLKNVASTIVIAKGKGFNDEAEKEQIELKKFFFKTLNDVVMTPELEATFPIWVFDNVEIVTDYSNYNNRLVVDKNLDSVIEDDDITLHWRISYYDEQKKVCDTKNPQKIAYRILEILFDC